MEVGNVITILENDIQAGGCVYGTQAPPGVRAHEDATPPGPPRP